MLLSMKLMLLALALIFAGSFAAAQTAVYPQQEGFVDAHGVLIYYKSLGSGPPLVVVHGGPGQSHDYFLPYLLPLARSHRLIFIDERGSGRSQRLQDVSLYTVENMVEDVEDVRAALNLGKISLLGHSCGGVIAEAYALKYQQNLSHLILNSTFPSTKQMNEVLAREKAQMSPAKLKRLNELERAGLPLPRRVRELSLGSGLLPVSLRSATRLQLRPCDRQRPNKLGALPRNVG
jgi:proline iminopeptidase